MFGEDTSESPRLPSPWRAHVSSTSPSPLQLPTPTSFPGTPEDSIPSSPHVRIRKQPSLETLLAEGLGEDFDQLSLGSGDFQDLTAAGGHGLAPEVDHKGHIEYKLKLNATSPHRMAKLCTQLRWRLVQGGGTALYELGVLDNGTLVGLAQDEMENTLQTLGRMLATFGGGEVRITRTLRVGGAVEESSADSSDDDLKPRRSFSDLFPSFHVEPAANPDVYHASPDDDGTGPPKPFRPTHPNPPLATIVLPISVKQAPHPERTPEERALLKRQKRDVRREKRQAENDFYPPVRHRPIPAHKQHRPSQATLSADSQQPSPLPLPLPLSKKQKKPSAKTLAKLAAMPAICPFKPRPMVEGEPKYVVEAVVVKQSRQSGGRTSSTSSEDDNSFSVEESEEDLTVGDEEEGWRFIDFDSLPRLRRGSGASSLGA